MNLFFIVPNNFFMKTVSLKIYFNNYDGFKKNIKFQILHLISLFLILKQEQIILLSNILSCF